MKKPAIHLLVFSFFLIFASSLGINSTNAQNNLLTNPGFEPPFVSFDVPGQPARQVAQGWNPWHVGGGRTTSENVQPEYRPSSDVTNGLGVPRIRSGDGQQYHSFFATHTGGVFQRVGGLTPGTQLEFSVFAYIWSSSFDDPNVSDGDGDVLIQVGIDPTGATDGESSAIVWSARAETYDTFARHAVTATAQGSAVTVFVRTTVGFPVKNNNVYLDDASLVVIGGGQQPPPDTPTNVSSATFTSTSTVTATATLTATATATSTSTLTPATTEEVEIPTKADQGIVSPTPTNTNTLQAQVPSATFTPTLTATSTFTTTATMTSTATTTSTSVPPPSNNSSPTPDQNVGSPEAPEPTDMPLPQGGPSSAFVNSIVHTVRRGETVAQISALYGSTNQAIIEANGLNQNALIFVGQRLVVPVRLGAPATATPTATLTPSVTPTGFVAPPPPPPPPPAPSTETIYIVQPGDTLSLIARRFNTTVAALAQLNGIVNANRILVGQRLTIPGTGGPTTSPPPAAPPSDTNTTLDNTVFIVVTATPSPGDNASQSAPQTTYVVQPGDNLFRISLRFQTTMGALMRANGIVDANRIFVGQRLVIP